MTSYLLCKFSIFLAFPSLFLGITTVHHDKPEESRIEKMATKMRQEAPVNTTFNSERQKRLLPYINYYLGNTNNYQGPNYQQQKTHQYVEYSPELAQREKFTPFLESNAIPGAFTPMVQVPQKNVETGFINVQRQQKVPNYGSIYEKLAQLKLVQQVDPYLQNYKISHGKPQSYNNHYDNRYKIVQPAKTIIETYTPTNIDITNEYQDEYVKPNNNENLVYQVYQQKPQVQQQQSYLVDLPRPSYSNSQYEPPVIVNPKQQIFGEKTVLRKPVVFYPKIQQDQNREYFDAQIGKPIVLSPIKAKPATVTTIIDDNYVAQKFTPVQEVQIKPYSPQPVQFVPQRYQQPKYEEVYYQTPAPVEVATEPTNSLSLILKQLQDSNTLPQTITADNIDNSIKTLVRILSALKTQQKLFKPVDEHVEVEKYNEFVEPHEVVPGTVTQSFPANTVDGGTPGRPGVDYPALSTIPQTSFNCKTQRYKGFFGDPHTNCQVWHYCDLNGGQASFLCPNGTIFSQVALTCDWWYNVKCAITTQLYVLNERLYKYILPLSPKFPEDYSGPLVDKYIALKFKEMEEKMRKEKEEKPKKEEEEDKDDSDQLLDIQKQNEEATSTEAT